MSKAFDKVWHDGIIFTLEQHGVTVILATVNKRSYLMGRTSDWGSIKSCVPQGSVLGPLLFLVYINDLEKGIKSSSKFFADDTALFSTLNNP